MEVTRKYLNKQENYEENFLKIFERKAKQSAQQGAFEGVTPSVIYHTVENGMNSILFSRTKKLFDGKLNTIQLRLLCFLNYGCLFKKNELLYLIGSSDHEAVGGDLRFLYSLGYINIDFSARFERYSISMLGREVITDHFARLAELKRKARKIIYKYFPLANRNYKYVTPKKHKEKLEALRGKRLK